MPVTADQVAAGPPGLEVTHTCNGFVLNERTADDWVKLTKLTGFHSLPEADDNRGPRTGRRGEIIYPSQERGKTIVYEGEVRAKTLTGLRTKATAMRNAFRNRNTEQFIYLGGVPVWHYSGRIMQLDMDDEQTNGLEAVWPWKRTFQLGIRMNDPRFYIDETEDFSTAGHASGSSHDYNNIGLVDTEPIFYVTLPADGDVTLENITDPDDTRILVWRNVPAGSFRVNFFLHRAHIGAGTGTLRYLDESASTWWDEFEEGMSVGVNTFRVTGGTWGVQFNYAVE